MCIERIYTLLILSFATLVFGVPLKAQTLQNGCVASGFGVDADVMANGSQFGNAISLSNNSDDWFYNHKVYDGNGIGIVDTTGGVWLKNQLQNGVNLEYLTKMSVPNNSIINNIRYQDVTYARDYFGGSGTIDQTSYYNASKNGEDPSIWASGTHNVTPKNDLIDCYAHLRRQGITANDDLWLFLGFSRVSNNGESYFDAELFAAPIQYDKATTQFSSAGPDEGHKAWKFDNRGNVIEVGDLIVATVLNTVATPTFELRIWVSRKDYNLVDPATFDFGLEFDGATNNSKFGYANIVAPSGNSFGCAVGNNKQTPGPPWGTIDANGNYSANYMANQFMEITLNLSDFGIDPAKIDLIDACTSPFNNVLFKARASSSFTAQLKDFNGPYPFGDINFVPASIVGGVLNCSTPFITLEADSLSPGAYYEWITPDGNIITNPIGSEIQIDEPGTYILVASALEGCEGIRDTFVVVKDTVPPIATITDDPIYGCDNVTSTLTAGEPGMNYYWTGPNGFTSTNQVISVDVPGLYILKVTRESNGCAAVDSIYVLEYPCQADEPTDVATTTIIDDIPPTFSAPPDITIDCQDDPGDLTLTGDVTDEDDNCDPAIGNAIYTDQINVNAGCEGNTWIERTWTLTDDCGNVTRYTQNIVMADTTPPVFKQPPDVTISCDDDPTLPGLVGTVTWITDDCDPNIDGAVYVDVVDDNSPCEGATVIHRTWSVTDDCGNVASATQTIVMEDTNLPTFTVPADVTLECDQDIDDLTIAGDVTDESDDCDMGIGEATYTDQVLPSGLCLESVVVKRRWALSDDCGNELIQTQTITIEDTTPPVFAAPLDVTISCDEDPNNTTLTGEIANATDNCDSNLAQATYTDIGTNNTPCRGGSRITRTWMMTDACGNTATATQQIILEDTTPPTFTIPADITIGCAQNPGDLGVTGIAFGENDNCDIYVGRASYSDEVAPDDPCTGAMVITRTWSLTDDCGNSNVQTQQITMEDSTPPDFTVPPDVTIQCDQNPDDLNLTGDVTDESDTCDSSIGEATYSDQLYQDDPCIGGWRIERTWTLTDACGNSKQHVQMIIGEDSTPPVLHGIPDTAYVQCDETVPLPTIGIDITVSDNCDADIPIQFNEAITPGNCESEQIILRTWTATDECGNSVSATQIVFIVDTEQPVILDFPADLTVACDAVPTPYQPIVQDNCDLDLTLDFVEDTIPGSCINNYMLHRSWTWTDNCGNSSSRVQSILVEDRAPPTFTTPDDITIECNEDPNDLLLTGDVTDEGDNCSLGTAEAVFTDVVVNNSPCEGALVITRTWSLSDECGNTTTGVQTITLEDTTPPIFSVPEDITISCDQNPDDLNITGDVIDESDDCDSNVGEANYMDVVNTIGFCDGESTITRVWTLADDCGNEFRDTQIIALIDTIPPLFSVPADVTLSCDQNPDDLNITGDVLNESDNCDSNIGEAIYADSTSTDTVCNGSIHILRTWMLTDQCGNIQTAVQQIALLDTTPPLFSAPADLTISCDVDPDDLNITGDVLNEADNCDNNVGEAVYSDDPILDTLCAGSSIIIRTWSLMDACGNETTAIQQITLRDTTPPVFTLPPDITISCETDPGNLTITGTVTNPSDNCDPGLGEATYTDQVVSNTPCAGAATISRTWSLTDNCGNETQLTQLIVLQDTTAPAFTAPEDITISCTQDPNDLNLTGAAINTSDNCDPVLEDATYQDNILSDTPCQGAATIERTWTLSDDCGNQTTALQIISIIDTIGPSFNPPADVTVYLDNFCALDTTMADIGAPTNVADDCSSSPTVTYSDDLSGLTGCNGTGTFQRIWTVTDACGNNSIQTQTVTVLDTIAPTFTTPADVTIYMDALCQVDTSIHNTGDVIDAQDNCEPPQIIYGDDLSGLTGCNGTGTFIRHWLVMDECGNAVTDTQYITVLDTLAPIFTAPADTTVYVDLNCQIDTTTLDIGEVTNVGDNCSIVPQVSYADNTSGLTGCNSTGTFERLWTVTDDCGNLATAIQIIIVLDTLAPVFTAPPDTVLPCDANPNDLTITGDVTDERDGCNPGLLDALHQDSVVVDSACSNAMTIYREWSLTDDCGNTFSQIQVITIVDNEPPSIIGVPEDAIVPCDSLLPVPEIGVDITAIDNCDPDVVISFEENSTPGSCGNEFLITRRWIAEDNCGNRDTVSQQVLVIDTLAPIIQFAPADLTVSCESVPPPADPAVVDNCDSNVNILYEEIGSDTICPNTYTLTRRWSWADSCGNTGQHIQTISVEDTTPPDFSVPPDVTLACDEDPNDLDNTGDVLDEFDNCDPNIGEAFYQDDTLVDPVCAGNMVIRRLWSLSDTCGNRTDKLQRITLVDTIAPVMTDVPADLTISCDSVPDPVDPTVSDICNSEVVLTFNESRVDGACAGNYTLTRIWTATDACGNEQQRTQHIEVINTALPVLIDVPADITVSCDSVPPPAMPTASDVCDTTVVIQFDQQITAGSCDDGYTITRIWTAIDGCGNQADSSQLITVIDTIAPVFDSIPPALTIACDSILQLPMLTATDNCDADVTITMTVTDTTAVCIGAYTYRRIWTATDNCGNTSSISQDITVEVCDPDIEITVGPDSIVCENEAVMFTVTVISDYNQLYYQWQYSSDNGGVWTDLAGATDSTLLIDPARLSDAGLYRCLVANEFTDIKDSLCNIQSDEAQLIVLPLPPPTDLSEIICEGDSVVVGNHVYTTSGSYSDTLVAANGCDSIVHLVLLVNDFVYTDFVDEICAGTDYQFGDTLVSDSGVYYDTLTAVSGCDSIVSLTLTIKEWIVTDLNETICEGDSILIGNSIYTIPGLYSDTLTAADGCDSVVNLVLSTLPPTVFNQTLQLCPMELYNGTGYASDTVLIDTLSTVFGCDSIVYTQIKLLPSQIQHFSVAICVGDTFRGMAYYSDTLLVDSLHNMHGCDSIIQTQLTVNPEKLDSVFVELCEGTAFNGVVYPGDTILVDSLSTVFGCDSVVLRHLTFVDNYMDTIDVVLCEGDLYNGVAYYADTLLTNSYTSTLGCDSIVHIALQVNPHSSSTIDGEICDGETFTIGDSNYDISGIYVDTLVNMYGCDSIVTLNLTVHDIYSETTSYDLCEGDLLNGQIYHSDTSWADTLSSIYGCDSILISNIIVHPLYSDSMEIQLCEGTPYNGNVYSTDTILTTMYTTIHGCDSTVAILLKYVPEIVDTLHVQLCEGEIYQGVRLINDTMLVNSYTSAAGCDSTEYVNIRVLYPSTDSLQAVICEGEYYTFAGNDYTSTGIYSTLNTGSNGCDSTTILDLTVLEVFNMQQAVTICEGEDYEGTIYFSDTLIVDSLIAVNGCDSIVATNVRVTPDQDLVLNVQLCEGTDHNGVFYQNDTVLIDSLITATGCDSVVITNIVFDAIYRDTMPLRLCYGDVYQGAAIFADTIISHYYTTTNGCDSIEVVDILMSPVFADTAQQVICEGDSLLIGGAYQTTSGVYQESWTTVHGCDSLYVTLLEVLPKSDSTISYSICEGDSVLIDGVYQKEAGTFISNAFNQHGCDSTIVITLAVQERVVEQMEFSICYGDSLFVGGAYQFDSGLFTDTLIAASGCDSLVSTQLEVRPANDDTFLEEVICEGDSLLIFGNYETQAGIYTDTYTDAFGCDSLVSVELIVEPVVELLADDYRICLGDEVQIEVLGADVVHWSPSHGLSCTDCPNPIASPKITTTYFATADNCAGTTVEVQATVEVNLPPSIEIEAEAQVVKGDTAWLVATTNDTLATIFWMNQFGDTLCWDCSEILVEMLQSASYIATVIDEEGCMNQDEVQIGVRDECVEGVLEIPNFITPNGDGYNDEFEIRYRYYSEVSLLRIYNRWGELVFETKDILTDRWDGTFRGQPLNPDVYVYYIIGYCLNGDEFITKGNITIIK